MQRERKQNNALETFQGVSVKQPKESAPRFAKISTPRLGHVLARTRLFARLDAARAHRAVWITGPPGAGKTTLAGSYIQERKLRAIWYQLDEGDSDIASFFSIWASPSRL